jgi:hypothetical protein
MFDAAAHKRFIACAARCSAQAFASGHPLVCALHYRRLACLRFRRDTFRIQVVVVVGGHDLRTYNLHDSPPQPDKAKEMEEQGSSKQPMDADAGREETKDGGNDDGGGQARTAAPVSALAACVRPPACHVARWQCCRY